LNLNRVIKYVIQLACVGVILLRTMDGRLTKDTI